MVDIILGKYLKGTTGFGNSRKNNFKRLKKLENSRKNIFYPVTTWQFKLGMALRSTVPSVKRLKEKRAVTYFHRILV